MGQVHDMTCFWSAAATYPSPRIADVFIPKGLVEYYHMIPAVVDAGSVADANCTVVSILADCKVPRGRMHGATAREGNRTANLGDRRVRSLREC